MIHGYSAGYTDSKCEKRDLNTVSIKTRLSMFLNTRKIETSILERRGQLNKQKLKHCIILTKIHSNAGY